MVVVQEGLQRSSEGGSNGCSSSERCVACCSSSGRHAAAGQRQHRLACWDAACSSSAEGDCGAWVALLCEAGCCCCNAVLRMVTN